jgi:hypothetical protein
MNKLKSPGRIVTLAGALLGAIGVLMWINGINDQQAMARQLLLVGAIMISGGAVAWELRDSKND